MTEPTSEQTMELIEQPAQTQSGLVPQQAASPSMLVQMAVQQGADLDKLERLMQMQIAWENRESEKAFRDAFANFRGENVIIPKSKEVNRGKAGSFMQAEYDQVCKRLSPAMSKHGFSFRHDQKFGSRKWVTDGVENDIAWVYVTCFLEHKLGHVEKLDLEGPPDDLSANTPTQNMQATASYFKRQSLLAITGTATGGEDDENLMRRGASMSDSDPLIEAGRNAAMEGMKPLTDWWGGLTAKQRGGLNKEFAGMRKAAALADQEAARG